MYPFLECAIIALMGGLLCYFIRAAPMVDAAFKTWAVWLIAAGTAWIVLAQFGFIGHLQRML